MFKQIMGASVAALCFATAPSLAQTWDFTAGKSYVFGDSLSDTGNVFLAAGAGAPPVYFNGRFSNGPVWHEYLTGDTLALSPFLTGIIGDASNGINFAHGGARTYGFASSPGGPILPGSIEQAQFYAAGVANGSIAAPTSSDIFSIWIGGNNFLSALSGAPLDINQGVADIQQTLTTLASAGARRFVLFGVPPIGTSVEAPAPFDAQFDQAAAQFNLGLRSVDAAISAQFGADVLYINVEDLLLDLYADPAAYGFSEVRTDCVSQGLLLDACPADWSDYDGIHPTTQSHAVLAAFVVASGMNDDYAGQSAGGLSEHAYQVSRHLIVDAMDEAGRARQQTGPYLTGGWLDGSVDAEAGRAGVDYDGWSVSGGFNANLDNGFFAGGRVSFADTTSSVDSALAASGEAETFAIAVHGGWSTGAFYVLGGAGLGRTDMDTMRATGFAPRNSVTGSWVIDHSFTALEAGFDFTPAEGFILTPYLRGVFTDYELGTNIEQGVLLAGRYQETDFSSTLYEAGLRAEWQVSDAGQLTAGLAYESEDDAERTLGVLLNDVDLSTAQAGGNEDGVLRAQLGYVAEIRDRLSIALTAAGRTGDGTESLQARLQVRLGF
ncbi:MAG: hypothetical protein CMH91_00275 [Oceanicaulis sp.]|uniref:autotransporter domain-containing protein n=1 Tax=unclassified Oceanicaulis TaxID=2632123 RepID=UPI000C6372ED|nr:MULTISPECIES: autotransporter domain-containing protein [unclassified Oceanicaulis]MBC37483.1 hypothetical protein [Oceanicaulis sp.]HBU63393.1 hypothetical protein [Oceanicaulis sp.]